MLTKSWPLTTAVIAWNEAETRMRDESLYFDHYANWRKIKTYFAEVVQGRLLEAISANAWPGSASFWYDPSEKRQGPL